MQQTEPGICVYTVCYFVGAVVAKRAAIIEASEISGPLDLLILGAGDLLDKIDDGSSKFGVPNLHERFGEPESVRRGKIVRYILWRRCVDVCFMSSALMRRSIEEKNYRNLQYLRNMLQAACANTVSAFFIFLHLLERQSKGISDIRLGHIKHHAAHAQALSNIFINRVSSFPRHHSFPLLVWYWNIRDRG
jgi:hypothetical protein